MGVADDTDNAVYKNSIGILPSSIPAYHRAYMAKLKAEKKAARRPEMG